MIPVDGGRYTEDDLMPAIDAGAEDVRDEEDLLRVLCEPADLRRAPGAGGRGVELESAEVTMEPKNTVEVTGNDAKSLVGLIERSKSTTTSTTSTPTSTSPSRARSEQPRRRLAIATRIAARHGSPEGARRPIKASGFPESDPMQW